MNQLNLDEIYQKTIDDQRTHLLALQKQFNKKCDEIRDRAKENLGKIPEVNREEREASLQRQKAELEEALRWLKTEVHESTRKTMKKLEGVQTQREEKVLGEIEAQIKAL